MQEKTDPQTVIAQINKAINYEEPENNSEMVDEAATQFKPEQKPSPASIDHSKVNPATSSKIAELIRQFGQQGPKQKITALTHMSEVITSEALGKVISNFNEEEKGQLL